MNKVFLIGRLTKDPEIRVTSTGKKVASFSLAVNEGKDANGQELVQFFNLSAWEKLAELIESYVKKGGRLAVVGRLQNRSWDKPDGSKGYATDVVVREMEILTSKSEAQSMSEADNSNSHPDDTSNTTSPAKSAKKSAKPAEDDGEDELPEIDIDSMNVTMPF